MVYFSRKELEAIKRALALSETFAFTDGLTDPSVMDRIDWPSITSARKKVLAEIERPKRANDKFRLCEDKELLISADQIA